MHAHLNDILYCYGMIWDAHTVYITSIAFYGKTLSIASMTKISDSVSIVVIHGLFVVRLIIIWQDMDSMCFRGYLMARVSWLWHALFAIIASNEVIYCFSCYFDMCSNLPLICLQVISYWISIAFILLSFFLKSWSVQSCNYLWSMVIVIPIIWGLRVSTKQNEARLSLEVTGIISM